MKHRIRAAVAFSLLPPAVAAHEDVATLTLLEGQVTLVRGPRGCVPAEGIQLMHADALPARRAKFEGRDLAPKPGPEYTYEDVEGWLKTGREVRRVRVPLMRSRASAPDFRASVVANLRAHPEWDPILFPEKYLPEEESKPSPGTAAE